MNLVAVIFIGVCVVTPSYSLIVFESQNVKIDNKYEELKAEKVSEKVYGHNFEIIQGSLNIGKMEPKFEICHDKNENLVYFQAFEKQKNGKLLGLFMADMKTNKIYKIVISSGKEKQGVIISKIWCSHGSLYCFEDKTNHFLMKFKGSKQFKAFHFNDKLKDISLDDQEKNNIAVLTQKQNSNKWDLISGDASEPRWYLLIDKRFEKIYLFYLKAHSVTTNKTVFTEKSFIEYNIAKDLLWCQTYVIKFLIKFQDVFNVLFFRSSKWDEKWIDMSDEVRCI
ncbi:hypothetical protein RF11_14653 [Thelohanellus kitauei]|uniref:Uncharacterized protein n=1 Tax=Thelohanellus kitauei TaxID=669202 RepID=A0A0C2J4P0_THEKT|nr:hypothetical protein RF11_14653 [Thelohanellus kitauei]